MDFLKSCSTGVQLLPGFGTISYHVYAVELKEEAAIDRNETTLEDVLASLESQLRERRYLVIAEAERHVLWIFRGGSGNGFADGPLDGAFKEPVRHNVALKCE